jgi:hypothetical protein
MARHRRYRRSYGRFRGYRRKASGFTLPIAPVIGIISSPAVSNSAIMLSQGNFPAAIQWAQKLVGIKNDGSFDINVAVQNLTPIALGLIAHKVVGSMLGVNKVLARARIPVVRF